MFTMIYPTFFQEIDVCIFAIGFAYFHYIIYLFRGLGKEDPRDGPKVVASWNHYAHITLNTKHSGSLGYLNCWGRDRPQVRKTNSVWCTKVLKLNDPLINIWTIISAFFYFIKNYKNRLWLIALKVFYNIFWAIL